MPNPDVVESIGSGAVFRTIRKASKRNTIGNCPQGQTIVFDDNETPYWALFWSHGLRKYDTGAGWRLCHIWDCTKNPDAFSSLANLCLIPTPLERLTDKGGPLLPYLKYHAQTEYGWRPNGTAKIEKPQGYDETKWNYLTSSGNPIDKLSQRFITRNSAKSRALHEIKGFNLQETIYE